MEKLNEIDTMVKETLKNIEDGTTKPKPDEPEGPANPWNKDGLEEVKVKDEEGNDVSIPKPEDSEILNPDATVDEGIVMKDANDNEWVWVPVDEATYNSMFAESETPIALSGSTGVTTTRYSTSASLIGQTQTLPGTTGYREPDVVTTYDSDSNAQAAGFANLTDMATNLVSEYNTMAESIQKYGGFYIGRYELTENGSKAGATLVSQTWYQLYKICKDLTIDETKGMTRMIWGCQWDAMCLWLKNCGYDITNSSSYGNYTGSEKNTGSSDTYKTNNIYDLAGNMWEWTQEATSNNNRTYRGGGYVSDGSIYSVSYRYYFIFPTNSPDSCRFSSCFHHKPITK